jgi:hypothetical protein
MQTGRSGVTFGKTTAPNEHEWVTSTADLGLVGCGKNGLVSFSIIFLLYLKISGDFLSIAK